MHFCNCFFISTTEKSKISAYENESPFEFYSAEFQDAYILTDSRSLNSYNKCNVLNSRFFNGYFNKSDTSKNGFIATATVFVEETYETIDGERIVKSSRLLNKDEVEEIGVDNFDNTEDRNSDWPYEEAEESKKNSTLTIGLLCVETSRTATSSQYEVIGAAEWDGFLVLNAGSLEPAVGEDFFGLCWFGDFTSTNYGCTVVYDGFRTINGTLAAATPNAGRVWSFEELIDFDAIKYYASPIHVYTTLTKNNLTGGGNNAELVLQYTHTYRELDGSVSISNSDLGFSVSGTSKQWSIACTVSNLYY